MLTIKMGNRQFLLKNQMFRYSVWKICAVIWGDAIICSTELDSLTLYPVVLPLSQILQFYVRISVYKISPRLVCVNGKHPGGSCSQSNSHNYTTEVSNNAKRKHCNNTAFRADKRKSYLTFLYFLYTRLIVRFSCVRFLLVFATTPEKLTEKTQFWISVMLTKLSCTSSSHFNCKQKFKIKWILSARAQGELSFTLNELITTK